MLNSRGKESIGVCLQETRFKGSGTRSFEDSDNKNKFFWQGNSEGTIVAIAINGRLIENVLEVSRVNEQVLGLKMVLEHAVCNFVSEYAPQAVEMIRK